jgi:hypothetical protein
MQQIRLRGWELIHAAQYSDRCQAVTSLQVPQNAANSLTKTLTMELQTLTRIAIRKTSSGLDLHSYSFSTLNSSGN